MVAAFGLVALSIVGAALAPAPHLSHRAGSPLAGSTRAAQTPAAPRHAPPVSPRELARAREGAARFLSGYLPFLYGRGSARAVDALTPGLRAQLTRDRPEVTPAERRRRPRIVSLTAVGQAPGVVRATALIEDGGVTAYVLRVTLREDRSGWLASAVDGG